MKQQTYVTESDTEEFRTSVRSFRSKDPRLTPPKIAILLKVSSSHLGRILRGDARLSESLYNKWFDEVEPKLSRRTKKYEDISSDKLVHFIKEKLPEEKEKVKSKLLVTDFQIYSALYYRRRIALLNIYDVIKGNPLYSKLENNEESGFNGEVVKELEQIGLGLTDLDVLGYYLLRDKKWMFSELIRSTSRKFQKRSWETLDKAMPKLKKISEYCNYYKVQLGKQRPETEMLTQITGKSMKELSKDCARNFGRDNFLKNNRGDYIKTTSIGKAMMILAMEKMENE